MSVGGPFSSSSETSDKTVNKNITVSDQGIAYAPVKSGNQKHNARIKLGKDATLTINNGLSADDFNAGLAGLAASLAPQAQVNLPSGDDDAFRQSVLLALEKRVDANTDRAVDEVRESAPSNIRKYLLWGVGIVVVFALVTLLRRKSK